MADDRKRITLRVSKLMGLQLEEAAEQTGMSVTRIIELSIIDHMDAHQDLYFGGFINELERRKAQREAVAQRKAEAKKREREQEEAREEEPATPAPPETVI